MKSGRNIRIQLGFDGSAYHGWQMQPSQITVQGVLREAIRKITGEEVNLIGSGRTDAGTHARSFVASFVTRSKIPASNLARALNSVLPRDVRVYSARQVSKSFHARRSAQSKVYRYQMYRGPIQPPHLAHEYFHYPYPIDLVLMKQAAALLVGVHDFASFAAKCGGEKNTVRQIFGCGFKAAGYRLSFTVEGNGFLHHMVRNLVGTLLEVGRGRMTTAAFQALFAQRDRTQAGFTVPAHGLMLIKVRYPRADRE
jgi:tRNA pseudouridine38-40 synthase